MKICDFIKNDFTDIPEHVEDFIYEYERLCQKYNVSLSHEDKSGKFIIEDYNSDGIDNIKQSILNVKEKPKVNKRKKPKHILRWQVGLFNDEMKLRYTYGSLDSLRSKAKVIANDDKVLFISIDRVDEVIKDVRSEKILEMLEDEIIE